MTELNVITFPILGDAKFVIKNNRIVHIASRCCGWHNEKCKCGFCMMHRPLLEAEATALYNFNIDQEKSEQK